MFFLYLCLFAHCLTYAQDKDDKLFLVKDSLGFRYHDFQIQSVMENCKGWNYDIDFDNVKDKISCLHLYTKNDLELFLKNINELSELKALSINLIKVDDFSFLSNLNNLEYLIIGSLNKKNIESFVYNVNKNSNIKYLDIVGLKMRVYPEALNNLKHIRSMSIENTKIKYMEATKDLKHLKFINNRRLKTIKADKTEYISFSFNKLKKMPDGLSSSKNLKGLEFSLDLKLKISCPLFGFNNLEVFNIIGTGLNIDENCFYDNKDVIIYQQQPHLLKNN